MRVVICPDKFAGTLSAGQAAQAIADGWRGVAPADQIVSLPLSDGGPGFIDVLAAAVGGQRIPVPTVDPLGRPVTGEVLVVDDTGYVESAHACGLHLLSPAELDPLRTTSYGLGVLVAALVERGVPRVVLGLGGSATNDGGAGMLAALGAAPLDRAGYVLPYGGAALCDAVGLTGPPRLRQTRLVAATDVDNPLIGEHGASAVYGPQKGASPADVRLLDAALRRFAEVLGASLVGCPPDLSWLPGAGAAGGLGAAVLALGGHRESGIALVRRLIGLDAALAAADLVITGEGSFDAQSLRGKVAAGVAAGARAAGLPCVLLAGRCDASREELDAAGITEAHSLVEHYGGVSAGGVRRAMEQAADGLRELAARLARRWQADRDSPTGPKRRVGECDHPG